MGYAAGSAAHERRAERKANKKDSKPGHRCRDGMQGQRLEETGVAGPVRWLYFAENTKPSKLSGRSKQKVAVNIKGAKVVRTANIKPTKAG
ncbi:fbl, partial [Symbiodinium necroappetens]